MDLHRKLSNWEVEVCWTFPPELGTGGSHTEPLHNLAGLVEKLASPTVLSWRAFSSGETEREIYPGFALIGPVPVLLHSH